MVRRATISQTWALDSRRRNRENLTLLHYIISDAVGVLAAE